jgi:hypothetical protein
VRDFLDFNLSFFPGIPLVDGVRLVVVMDESMID